jgi:hypothetical protein
MSEIAGLIREFPVGTFFILLALIGAVVSIVRAVVNRHRPLVHCDHDCCDEVDEDEEDEEEED